MKSAVTVLREQGIVAVALRCTNPKCGMEVISEVVEDGFVFRCPQCADGDLVPVDEKDLPSREEQIGILMSALPVTCQIYHRSNRPGQKAWVLRWGVKEITESDDLLSLLRVGTRLVEHAKAQIVAQKPELAEGKSGGIKAPHAPHKDRPDEKVEEEIRGRLIDLVLDKVDVP